MISGNEPRHPIERNVRSGEGTDTGFKYGMGLLLTGYALILLYLGEPIWAILPARSQPWRFWVRVCIVRFSKGGGLNNAE